MPIRPITELPGNPDFPGEERGMEALRANSQAAETEQEDADGQAMEMPIDLCAHSVSEPFHSQK